MARADNAICDVFGQRTEVVLQFITRQPEFWLKSTYKHNQRNLARQPSVNTGTPDDVLVERLALNRFNLSDSYLRAAKADLLGKAHDNDE